MERPLKIGILCHPTYGGSGVVASELAITLAQKGHVVHVFSHAVPPRLARSPGPVQMHRAEGVPYPLFTSTPHDLAITSCVLDVHRDDGLDVVHAHYALPHAVSAHLVRAASKADSGRTAPKVIVTLHGTDITLVGNDPSYAPLTQFVIADSDAATAVSTWLAEETKRQFCTSSNPECDIEVIPNFVDTQRFHPQAAERNGLCIERDIPTAVHVSNFRPVKRVPWLIEAFEQAARGKNARLVLIGDGPDQPACRERVHALGIESKVQFLGERGELPELLASGCVFALASDSESFGLSALEAMSCGTPVVSTDAGGVNEVVTHGSTGLLSPLDDAAAFAEHLAALLFDGERAREMGNRAREDALERFRREKVVTAYEDLYRRVLEPAL